MDLFEPLSPIEQCFPQETVMAFVRSRTPQASELRFYQRFSRDKMSEKLRVGIFDRVLSELRAEIQGALRDHRDRVNHSIQDLLYDKSENSIQ
jgi:hypothetical protein